MLIIYNTVISTLCVTIMVRMIPGIGKLNDTEYFCGMPHIDNEYRYDTNIFTTHQQSDQLYC